MNRGFACMVLLTILGLASVAHAELNEGVQAYKAGNFGKALVVFTELASAGNTEAQNYLGDMYERGEGVKLNFDESAAWHRKAAEQGNARAQFAMSIKCAAGLGVAKDEAMADKWLFKAADNGWPEAQNSVGVMYYYGQVVPKDYVQALSWTLKAEFQGFADAKHNHAVFVEEMTPEQIAAAYRLANTAVPGGGQ